MRKMLAILSVLLGLGLILSSLLFFDRLVGRAWQEGGMSGAVSFLLLLLGGGGMFVLIGWLIWQHSDIADSYKGYDVHPEDVRWEEDADSPEDDKS